MDGWRPLGRHRIRRDGLVFLLETQGELSPADAAQLIDAMMAADAQDPHIGVLADLRRGFALPAEARRIIAARSEEQKHRPTMPLAILGASLPVRALVTLLINAVGIIRRRRQLELAFFASEAEAVAWLSPLAVKRGQLTLAQEAGEGESPRTR
jgi:hypothetical protein